MRQSGFLFEESRFVRFVVPFEDRERVFAFRVAVWAVINTWLHLANVDLAMLRSWTNRNHARRAYAQLCAPNEQIILREPPALTLFAPVHLGRSKGFAHHAHEREGTVPTERMLYFREVLIGA